MSRLGYNDITNRTNCIVFFVLGQYGAGIQRGSWLKARTNASDTNIPSGTNLPNIAYGEVPNAHSMRSNPSQIRKYLNAFWFSEWDVGEIGDGAAHAIVYRLKD